MSSRVRHRRVLGSVDARVLASSSYWGPSMLACSAFVWSVGLAAHRHPSEPIPSLAYRARPPRRGTVRG